MLSLGVGGLTVGPMPADGEAGKGIYMAASDTEELALVLRVGNEVEIRPGAR